MRRQPAGRLRPSSVVIESAYLTDLPWPQVEGRAARVILVIPVGATEQHGPHLPLSTDTDTDIALPLCERLAATRSDVLIAPAVAYGSSGEHTGLAGTLSIGQDATELLLVELGRSACDTFARLLFVLAHGGNAIPAARAVQRLCGEGREVRVYAPHWDEHPHAGRPETSMALAVRPERVRMECAEPGDERDLTDVLAELRTDAVRAVSANGVLGDPRGANAAEGTRCLTRSPLNSHASWTIGCHRSVPSPA